MKRGDCYIQIKKTKMVEKIEASAHHFMQAMKTECEGTREAGAIMRKYVREGKITKEEEAIVKSQLIDSLKIAGIMVPFVLIPGASILMPILIKVADKHGIALLPASFSTKQVPQVAEVQIISQ